jgi:hypothetical protein
MKHLLITAMIAILIGTMQAVRIKTTTSSESQLADKCTVQGARLEWKPIFFWQESADNVKSFIDGHIARGLRNIKNTVATFGWDRCPGREKVLKMDW